MLSEMEGVTFSQVREKRREYSAAERSLECNPSERGDHQQKCIMLVLSGEAGNLRPKKVEAWHGL